MPKRYAYSSAPFTSRSTSILWRQVEITVETSLQLSRRTVWKNVRFSYIYDWEDTNLDTLRIHLVVLLGLGPIQSRVSLLVDQQVRKIDLLELEFDRFDELCGNKVGSLAPYHGWSSAPQSFQTTTCFDTPICITVARSVGPKRTMTESVSP